jgi:hypothetical protein
MGVSAWIATTDAPDFKLCATGQRILTDEGQLVEGDSQMLWTGKLARLVFHQAERASGGCHEVRNGREPTTGRRYGERD